jgi:hypothetical protein
VPLTKTIGIAEVALFAASIAGTLPAAITSRPMASTPERFASLVELHAGALVVSSDPFFNTS